MQLTVVTEQITRLEIILKKLEIPKCMVEINPNCRPFCKYSTKNIWEGAENKEKEEKIIKDKTNLFCSFYQGSYSSDNKQGCGYSTPWASNATMRISSQLIENFYPLFFMCNENVSAQTTTEHCM